MVSFRHRVPGLSPRRREDVAPRSAIAAAAPTAAMSGSVEALEERLLLFVAFGTKWGDPEFGAPAAITYSFVTQDIADASGGADDNATVTNLWESINLTEAEVRLGIRNSFDRWTAAAGISFVEVADDGADSGAPTTSGDIRIGAHPQEGSVAHAFFPPQDGIGLDESITGDLHFDPEFTYRVAPGPSGPDFTFELIATHEIGHAIGLGHTDVLGVNSVMESGLSNTNQSGDLSADDTAGAQFIYGFPLPEPGEAVLFSTRGGGSLQGSDRRTASFTGSDIVRFTRDDVGTSGTFDVLFDGSDVGVPAGAQIDGFSVDRGGNLVMSFSRAVTIDGIRVERADLVRFAFASDSGLGNGRTAGRFDLYFDASDVGLGAGADIDAVSLVAGGDILLSFSNSGVIGGVAYRGEDVLRFSPNDPGPVGLGGVTNGVFAMEVDGSDVGLSSRQENVDALSAVGTSFQFSTQGTFVTPTVRGTGADIFTFNATALGNDTTGNFDPDLLVDGRDLRRGTGRPLDVTGFAFPIPIVSPTVDPTFPWVRPNPPVVSPVPVGPTILPRVPNVPVPPTVTRPVAPTPRVPTIPGTKPRVPTIPGTNPRLPRIPRVVVTPVGNPPSVPRTPTTPTTVTRVSTTRFKTAANPTVPNVIWARSNFDAPAPVVDAPETGSLDRLFADGTAVDLTV